MNYEIKRLQHSDVEDLKKLLMVFSRVFHDTENDLPEDAYLQAQLEKQEVYIIAASDKEEIVGGLVGYEFALPSKKEKELYLYDLAVDERYRRQGVASALISELKACAGKNGVALIFVEAETKDAEAVSFYSSQRGRQTSVEHFDIAIG